MKTTRCEWKNMLKTALFPSARTEVCRQDPSVSGNADAMFTTTAKQQFIISPAWSLMKLNPSQLLHTLFLLQVPTYWCCFSNLVSLQNKTKQKTLHKVLFRRMKPLPTINKCGPNTNNNCKSAKKTKIIFYIWGMCAFCTAGVFTDVSDRNEGRKAFTASSKKIYFLFKKML